jgi:hypothetical protein
MTRWRNTMLTRTLTAAAVLGLAATGAYAQQTKDKHVDMPIEAQTGKAAAQALNEPAAPSAADAANEVATTELSIFNKPETPYVADNVSGPTAGGEVLITMAPVPDDAETRSKYRPLSNAGRRSPAAGN